MCAELLGHWLVNKVRLHISLDDHYVITHVLVGITQSFNQRGKVNPILQVSSLIPLILS